MNEDFFSKENNGTDIPNEFKTGLAVASFVLSLVNFVCCMFTCSFIFAPLSVILGVISLATHRGGKAFAVLGIVISAVGLAVFSFYMSIYIKIYPDVLYFEKNSTAIISEFEKTGDIPEQYEKYRTSEYDEYWNAMGCEDFDEFFSIWIEAYKSRGLTTVIPDSPDNDGTPEESRDRETPVELKLYGCYFGNEIS